MSSARLSCCYMKAQDIMKLFYSKECGNVNVEVMLDARYGMLDMESFAQHPARSDESTSRHLQIL